MSVKKYIFGYTAAKEQVDRYEISNQAGAKVSILTYGGIVQSLSVPDRNGIFADVVLGFSTVEAYEKQDAYIGALVGRCANRIENACFVLNGTKYSLFPNDGKNHLHGGKIGFNQKIWKAETEGESLLLFLESADGEEGYPGNVKVCVTYTLTEENALEITYTGKSDKDTILNLTNHSYFNLKGEGNGSILDHTLQLFAKNYTENSQECLPTGVISPVEGTPMDFLTPKRVGRDIDASFVQLGYGQGYDHNWILDKKDKALCKAAVLQEETSGRKMEVYTTMPGIQLYTANALNGSFSGKSGVPYTKRCALCLETQFFPNAVKYSHFPSPVLKAGEPYYAQTIYRFGIVS